MDSNESLLEALHKIKPLAPVTQADLDALAKRFKPPLLGTTAYYAIQPLPTFSQVHDIHMAAGFELGLLEVIDDVAYEKATHRKRAVVVYTTPKSRASMELRK